MLISSTIKTSMKRIGIISSLTLYIALGLVACRQPTTVTVPTVASTLLETASPKETSATTPILVLTSEPTDTPRPNPTTKSLPTATLSVTSNANLIEIPDWLNNLDNDVILLAYQNEQGGRPVKAGLINLATGERVFIELQQEFLRLYWRNAQYVVFVHRPYCNEPPESVTELDISQGALEQYQAQDYPEPIRDCYPVSGNPIVQFSEDLPEQTVMLVDPTSGKEHTLTNPNDGIVDVTFQVSPNQKYIAVSQAPTTFEIPEIWSPNIGNQISIYSLADQTLLLTVTEEGDLASLKFFPDSNQVAYMRDWESTPCLIVISDQSKKCIHNIPQSFPGVRIYLGEPTADSKKIGFLYLRHPQQGGLCFYDLFSGTIECPTDNFANLEGYGLLDYSLSPDEKYVVFIYDKKGCPQPWCDYAANRHIAVMDINGMALYELGDSTEIQDMFFEDYGLRQMWRPLVDAGP